MKKDLHVRTTVLPGGKVEVVAEELTEGESVDVLISPSPPSSGRSVWEVISEGAGQRLFRSAQEVDDYIAGERASWDR